MMRDPRDYKLDLSASGQQDAKGEGSAGRPFLSVRFACCNVYQRIYRNADGSAYRGRCPRCGQPVQFRVGPGGVEARFFVVR
jgi:endogenous inhibitor of DNA gyrase (YacG/DUF329 family)